METNISTAQPTKLSPIKRVYLALWVVLVVWSYLKGFNPNCQIWGKYFWLIDYSEGFIKRGLMGTVFSYLGYTLDTTSWDRIASLVVLLHTVLAILLIALLAKWQHSYLLKLDENAERNAFILFACWLIFACTQFWPTLAFNAGYVDIYLLVAFTIAFYWMTQRQPLAAALLGCVAILIHESFIFLWSNILTLFVFVPLLQVRKIDKRAAAMSLLPLVMVGVLLIFHDQSAAIAEIKDIPNRILDKEMKDTLINALFAQSTVDAFKVMVDIWTTNAARGWVAVLYYTWPSLLTILSLPFVVGGNARKILGTIVLATIASLLPLSILLVAWDLSRFLVWANLTTILTVSYFAGFFSPRDPQPIQIGRAS